MTRFWVPPAITPMFPPRCRSAQPKFKAVVRQNLAMLCKYYRPRSKLLAFKWVLCTYDWTMAFVASANLVECLVTGIFLTTFRLIRPRPDHVFTYGWSESIDVSRRERPALVRFVVREPNTGNLGSVDLSTHARDWLIERKAPEGAGSNGPRHILVDSDPLPENMRRNSLLGSPLPNRAALCGDVYELPLTTTFLPDDFRTLNAVGAIYADRLNVPEQILNHGIPGSTPRSEWFGIDYFGEFWVSKAGVYRFVLNADDGADLLIDDQVLINNDGIHPPVTKDASISLDTGRHTIHIPYFQGPTYVNLIVQIQAPGDGVPGLNCASG